MSAAPGDAEHPFGSFMDVLVAFDKPLLAAVNGVGVGIGLTMLLHCDVVYVAEEARLRAPSCRSASCPKAAASHMLPLIIGYQRAAEVLYTGDWIDARRAVELGLASRVCTRAELVPALLEVAARMAAGPIGSIRHTKRLLLATRAEQVRAARAREDAGFVERVGTPENMEAIMAFFGERPPDFRSFPAEPRVVSQFDDAPSLGLPGALFVRCRRRVGQGLLLRSPGSGHPARTARRCLSGLRTTRAAAPGQS